MCSCDGLRSVVGLKWEPVERHYSGELLHPFSMHTPTHTCEDRRRASVPAPPVTMQD